MSLSSNLVLADHYFEEEEMCPPPDPSYLARTKAFLSQNKKQNLMDQGDYKCSVHINISMSSMSTVNEQQTLRRELVYGCPV